MGAKRRSSPRDWERYHRVDAGTRPRLARIDPAHTNGYKDRGAAAEEVDRLKAELTALQELLWADQRFAVLVVFQAMDAGGKDGCIRSVMSGLNPQGCQVTSFKVPTPEERAHDFLWRIHRAAPAHGLVGIFNRSHYEDVLIVRVRGLVPEEVWSARYEQINRFEKLLDDTRTLVIKFYLHISKEEQERRFLKRLLEPHKNWKFLPEDLRERSRWRKYMKAYEDAIRRCSTPWAPWYVIPADHKWYRDLAVARILVARIRELPLRWPRRGPETRELARQAEATGKLPRLR